MHTDLIIIDAQLPPSLVPFFRKRFSIKAVHVNELDQRQDEDIFFYARKVNAYIFTKDSDFEGLVKKQKSPPKVLFIEYGNVGKTRLKELLEKNFCCIKCIKRKN